MKVVIKLFIINFYLIWNQHNIITDLTAVKQKEQKVIRDRGYYVKYVEKSVFPRNRIQIKKKKKIRDLFVLDRSSVVCCCSTRNSYTNRETDRTQTTERN